MRRAVGLAALLLGGGLACGGGPADVVQCSIDAPGPAACATPVAAPAWERLGLRQGDIVLSVNGKKIASPSDPGTAFRGRATGEVRTVEILRDGRRRTLRTSP
jgi:S1-C subfamily serine protease